MEDGDRKKLEEKAEEPSLTSHSQHKPSLAQAVNHEEEQCQHQEGGDGAGHQTQRQVGDVVLLICNHHHQHHQISSHINHSDFPKITLNLSYQPQQFPNDHVQLVYDANLTYRASFFPTILQSVTIFFKLLVFILGNDVYFRRQHRVERWGGGVPGNTKLHI